MNASPSLDAFSACLLSLHRRCHELPVRAFQAFALEQLRSVLSFDSALFATGTIQAGVPHAHDFYLDNQPPELMTSWESIKELDRVSFLTVSQPGRTHAFVVSEIYAGVQPILDHSERFSIRQMLSTASIAARAGSYAVLSLYRKDEGKPFSEPERAIVELIVPHLIESSRQAHLSALRHATQARAQSAHSAIINRQGIVLEAEPAFIELLAQHYPQWNGPALPKPLCELATLEKQERRALGRLTCWVDPSVATDVTLLRARTILPVDGLSERERQVAQLFASGENTKEVAERLSIAPNTVRVHISRVYEKLGVVNKAELASMLAGLE